MIDLKKLNNVDPLKRMVEKVSGVEELSPMDPPDPFAPPVVDRVPYEDLHPSLQKLMDDHKLLTEKLNAFEQDLIGFKREGWVLGKEAERRFSAFFAFMDDSITRHHMKEEKVLYPLLHKKLLEARGPSLVASPRTAVDMLEDDHVKIGHHLTLMFNFLALAHRLPEAACRALTFDVATEQGFALIELLRLHIFREENIAYPQVHRHLTREEFEPMMKEFDLLDRY
ncbi:MAG TPA: hemerythrin domain-containing protein [Chryseosolibacter sp.]